MLVAIQILKAASYMFTTTESLIYTKDELREIPPVSFYDNSPFTKQEYDFILTTYKSYIDENKEHWSTNALVMFLNSELGRHKSKTSYIQIWNGSVDRNSLSDDDSAKRG